MNSAIHAEITHTLSSATSEKDLIAYTASYAKHLTNAQRCSLFFFSKEKDLLQSVYADGIKGNFALKSNLGIVGYAFHKKISVLENDPSSSQIFFKLVDQKTKYKTESILAVPLMHNERRLGVIELLNKKDGFTQEDQKNLEALVEIFIDCYTKEHQEKQHNDTPVSSLEKKLERYLDTKKLYLMENGYAYYKLLGMKREYFIAADICYQLQTEPVTCPVFYYSTTQDFLSEEMQAKIQDDVQAIYIAEKQNQFQPYQLEEEDAS